MPDLGDVTVPAEGSTTARWLSSQALRRTLHDLVALPRGAVSEPAWVGYLGLRHRLGALSRHEPAALASVARRPNVGTRVRCLRDVDRDDVQRDALLTELVTIVTAELAAANQLDEPVRLTDFAFAWTSWIDRARRTVPGNATALVFDGETLQAQTPAGLRPVASHTNDDHGLLFAPVTAHTVLCRADDNPLAAVEAHPDKDGNAVDLGGHSVSTWCRALADAHDLLGAHIPALQADFDALIQQIIPVGYDDTRHVSASYRENLGTIYVSLHPDPMTMAEALIHEMSHNKLNALLELDPLLLGGEEARYPSPLRPDPRPLTGILLAVHAFVPVVQLYTRMMEAGHPWAARPDFLRRRTEIIAKNHDGIATVAQHAQPTARGTALLAELVRWDSHFRGA